MKAIVSRFVFSFTFLFLREYEKVTAFFDSVA